MTQTNESPWTIEPGARFGPFRFGMPRAEAETILSSQPDLDIVRMDFEDEKLVELEVGEDIEGAIFYGWNLLELDRLTCALYVAGASSDFGQSMGGSLHFEDLWISILQYEIPGLRTFVFRMHGRDSGEALAPVGADGIVEYFVDQAKANARAMAGGGP